MEFNNIREVAVYGTAFVLDVSQGDDDTCRLVTAKEKSFSVQADNNGVLTVTQKKSNILSKIIMRKLECKLVLPKSFNGRLRFRNKNGGLYIKDCTLGEVDIYTKNGKFDIQNISCGELALKMKNGSSALKNVTCAGNVAVKCSNGNIKAETASAQSLSLSCHNAGLCVIDARCAKLDCNTDNGSIDASGINASDIRLETSNGRVNALLIGARDDFRLTLETSNGSIAVNGTPCKNITDPAGAKNRVEICTSNGDVDLKFI